MSGNVTDEMRKVWRFQVNYLLENAATLSSWEIEFVDSLEKWLSVGRDLTWKQSKILRRLFNEEGE